MNRKSWHVSHSLFIICVAYPFYGNWHACGNHAKLPTSCCFSKAFRPGIFRWGKWVVSLPWRDAPYCASDNFRCVYIYIYMPLLNAPSSASFGIIEYWDHDTPNAPLRCVAQWPQRIPCRHLRGPSGDRMDLPIRHPEYWGNLTFHFSIKLGNPFQWFKVYSYFDCNFIQLKISIQLMPLDPRLGPFTGPASGKSRMAWLETSRHWPWRTSDKIWCSNGPILNS